MDCHFKCITFITRNQNSAIITPYFFYSFIISEVTLDSITLRIILCISFFILYFLFYFIFILIYFSLLFHYIRNIRIIIFTKYIMQYENRSSYYYNII